MDDEDDETVNEIQQQDIVVIATGDDGEHHATTLNAQNVAVLSQDYDTATGKCRLLACRSYGFENILDIKNGSDISKNAGAFKILQIKFIRKFSPVL